MNRKIKTRLRDKLFLIIAFSLLPAMLIGAAVIDIIQGNKPSNNGDSYYDPNPPYVEGMYR